MNQDDTPPIRPAVAADRAAVIALWEACGLTRPWNDPRADFDRAVSADAALILVIERAGGSIDGSVMIGDDGHRGWVYYLAVADAARRQGLGLALMAAAERWLRDRGCPKLQLMVRDGNDAATGFYRALGLTPQPVVTLGRFLK
ncbi:GNAT family acetyltransferase [Sphingomonas sp. RS6]